MRRRKRAIYQKQPDSVIFMGNRYVLADKQEEGEQEESPKRTGPTRVSVDHCKGSGITFHIEAIVHSYDGVGVPGLRDADQPVSGRSFKVKRVSKLTDIPAATLKQLEEVDGGEAVLKRIERYLKVKPSPPLYFISAYGGWNWNKKHGDREVASIQNLLEYLRGRRAILYSYCSNKIDMDGGSVGLI
jgi:hypothetical protein